VTVKRLRGYKRASTGAQNLNELNRQMSEVDLAIHDIERVIGELTTEVNKILNGTIDVVPRHALTHLPDGSDPLTTVAPTFSFSTAAAAGVALSFIRSDATLALFDATVPSILSNAAAVGAAGKAARRDHTHKSETSGDWYADTNGKGLVTVDAQGTPRYWRVSVTNGAGNPTGGATLSISNLGVLTAARDALATGTLQIRIDDLGTTPP
jgi:hypothetical protein